MRRQVIIGKYCYLVDYHYELADEITTIGLEGTVGEQNIDKKIAELEEDLEQTESKLTELHEELKTEDVRFLLNELLE